MSLVRPLGSLKGWGKNNWVQVCAKRVKAGAFVQQAIVSVPEYVASNYAVCVRVALFVHLRPDFLVRLITFGVIAAQGRRGICSRTYR